MEAWEKGVDRDNSKKALFCFSQDHTNGGGTKTSAAGH